MTITLQIPSDVEQRLRTQVPDLDAAVREAALVGLYRQGRLTHHELATALGLSRYLTDGVLKQHGVVEDLPTPDEHAAQVEHLRRLVG